MTTLERWCREIPGYCKETKEWHCLKTQWGWGVQCSPVTVLSSQRIRNGWNPDKAFKRKATCKESIFS